MGWGGGKGWNGGGGSWSSQEGYVEKMLRQNDLKGYSAAGLVPWKKDALGDTLILVTRERPWNSYNNDYDPICWQLLGGRRQGATKGMEQEFSPYATAARVFIDTLGNMDSL